MVYFANFQHILFLSDLLSCTTKLDEPRVLYVCFTASRELWGLMEWSIPRIPSSRLVMSFAVATCFIRVHSACRVCEPRIHSIQTKGVRGSPNFYITSFSFLLNMLFLTNRSRPSIMIQSCLYIQFSLDHLLYV
jgi:hypothetical protein